MNAQSTVEILPDESHLAEAAADRFVGIVEATLRYRQVADVALAGGSTPRAMNALLAAAPPAQPRAVGPRSLLLR